ncbi:MAG: FHA domain-containing protein, partial [Akkermansia sp.]|nr:FHA domain-containing protein [Akkermansia sp.]
MLSLTIINSDNICNVFNLDSSPGSSYTLGRSADCDIALTNEMHLSRIHCILTVGMGCVLITDNNSSNGIYEDDNRVSEIIALPGKVYRIGNCNLSIEYKADEQPQEPSPDVSDSAQEDYVDAEEHHPSHRDYYEDEPRHRSRHSHDRDYYEEEPRHRSRHSHDRDYYEDEPRHRSHHSHDRDYYEDEPRHRSHHAHDRDYYEDEPRHRSHHSHDRDYYEDEPRHR